MMRIADIMNIFYLCVYFVFSWIQLRNQQQGHLCIVSKSKKCQKKKKKTFEKLFFWRYCFIYSWKLRRDSLAKHLNSNNRSNAYYLQNICDGAECSHNWWLIFHFLNGLGFCYTEFSRHRNHYVGDACGKVLLFGLRRRLGEICAIIFHDLNAFTIR